MKPIDIIKKLDSLNIKNTEIKEENRYGLEELANLNKNCLNFIKQLVSELAKNNLEKEPDNEEWKLISSIDLKDEVDKTSEFIKSIDKYNKDKINSIIQDKNKGLIKKELYDGEVEKNSALEEQNKNLEENNSGLTTENAELKDKLESLEKEFSNLRTSYNTNYAEVSGIKKELQDKKEQQVKYWSENQYLSKKLEEKTSELENFKLQLTDRVEEYSKVVKDKEELIKKYKELETEFNRLNTELESIKKEQESEDSLDKRIKDLTNNNLEYASQIRVQEEKLRQAEEIDSGNKARISELEKEIAKKMTELKNKEEQYTELSNKIDKLEKELEVLNKSISDINSKLDNRDNLSIESQPNNKGGNTEIEELKGVAEALLGQIENLERNNRRV